MWSSIKAVSYFEGGREVGVKIHRNLQSDRRKKDAKIGVGVVKKWKKNTDILFGI